MKLQEPIQIPTKTKNIVDAIKSEDYRVKITHYRYFGNRLLKNADIRVLVKAMKIMNNAAEMKSLGGMINNRGGLTEVEITKGDEKYFAQAECSKSDIFNYSKAARLALYRAINQMPGLEDLKTKIRREFLKFSVQIMENRWKDVEKFVFELGKEYAVNRARQIGLETNKEYRVVESFE